MMESNTAHFQWKRKPRAWNFVHSKLDGFCRSNPGILKLAGDLLEKAATRLIDVTDCLVLNHKEGLAKHLEDHGYVKQSETGQLIFDHPGARIPRILVTSESDEEAGVAVSVDSVETFLKTNRLDLEIEGAPLSDFRRCKVASSAGTALWVVERRVCCLFSPVEVKPGYEELYNDTLLKWQSRPRNLEDGALAVAQLLSLAREQVDRAGIDLAAYLFAYAEREYWQSRNRAARVQKESLDQVGVGWSNHDHHAYRSSRENFRELIRFFEILGFFPREHFYAGAQAGWGAQVMENQAIGVVLFLDVDLGPDELDIDYLEAPLPPVDSFGTIGLWCALHGDSLLSSGLHHLAVESDFDRLVSNLGVEGIQMMEPFSTLPYLRQAFTQGETWQVDKSRLEKLVREKVIDKEAASRFSVSGAIGSHLENIQREDGYKGFSQREVSVIIKGTDPRLG